jgi:hypothetical protein
MDRDGTERQDTPGERTVPSARVRYGQELGWEQRRTPIRARVSARDGATELRRWRDEDE